jgi:uncharacterized protein with PIN domain
VAPCRLLNEEKRKLYNKYLMGSSEERAELEKKYGQKQIQSLIAELDSEAWLDEYSKLCPSCSARIEVRLFLAYHCLIIYFKADWHINMPFTH